MSDKTSGNEVEGMAKADTVMASVIYLLTSYNIGENSIADPAKKASLAGPIAYHLKLLEENSGLNTPLLKKTCRRLRSYWLNEQLKTAEMPNDGVDLVAAGRVKTGKGENSNSARIKLSGGSPPAASGKKTFSNIH